MTTQFLKNVRNALSQSQKVFATDVTETQLAEVLAHQSTLGVSVAVFKADKQNGNSARTVKRGTKVLALALVGAGNVPFAHQRNFSRV